MRPFFLLRNICFYTGAAPEEEEDKVVKGSAFAIDSWPSSLAVCLELSTAFKASIFDAPPPPLLPLPLPCQPRRSPEDSCTCERFKGGISAPFSPCLPCRLDARFTLLTWASLSSTRRDVSTSVPPSERAKARFTSSLPLHPIISLPLLRARGGELCLPLPRPPLL